jgi:putative membrane protein
MSTYQRIVLGAFVLIAALSCWRAPYPREMYLQHLPTAAVVAGLLVASRRFSLSNAAFSCLIAFMLLHVLGARYIYSNVPYDRWAERLFGADVTGTFGFERNHYDRLVHFCFGALAVYPVWEVCVRYFGVPRRFAYYTAFEFVLAFSMLYELVEWGLALVLAPEDAAAYNGQQGDMWDAQKDMSLALVGAALALGVLLVVHRKRCDSGPQP